MNLQVIQLKLISFLVNWHGPTDKTWPAECSYINTFFNNNLDQCKKLCLETTGCTAIHYMPDLVLKADCILRGCSLPVPNPSLKSNGYQGYYLTIGTIKNINNNHDILTLIK